MKIERLAIGTSNPTKLTEWGRFLDGAVSYFGTGQGLPAPEETGKTFAENARLKASHYARISGEYVLSDDGGFMIDVLDGLPGVKSRRILPDDREGTDEECINWVIERMRGVPQKKRGAKIVSTVAIAAPDGRIIYEDTESIAGFVPLQASPTIEPGYPFRSVLVVPEFNKVYVELSQGEHDKVAVRGKVAGRIVKFLRDSKDENTIFKTNT